MAIDADRKDWPTDQKAYEMSVRLLAKKFPDSNTYRAQAQVLDENFRLREAIEAIAGDGWVEGEKIRGEFKGLTEAEIAQTVLKEVSCAGSPEGGGGGSYPSAVVGSDHKPPVNSKEMEHPDCGDNSCMFAEKKGGMRPNGGCRCFESGKLYGASDHDKTLVRELRRMLDCSGKESESWKLQGRERPMTQKAKRTGWRDPVGEMVDEWLKHNKRGLTRRGRTQLEIMVAAAMRNAAARGVMRALEVTCCGHWRCPEVARTRELARRLELGITPLYPVQSDGVSHE